MSDVDIVIVNYRSAAHTAACIDAARTVAQADHVDASIVVVDNGDTIELNSVIAPGGAVTVLRNPENLGFGVACNRGADLGSARLILFLNPDARLKLGCLKAMTAFMDDPENRNTGIVGPSIGSDDGSVAATSSPLPTISALMMRSLGLSHGFLPLHEHLTSGPVGQVMGAVLMIRRDLFGELGGFDPRFFLYYEDVDLCARAAAIGMRTYYLASAHASHAGRASSSHDTGLALALFLRGRITYARLHFGLLAQYLLVAASYLAELPLRLLGTLRGGKSITGMAVLRAYRLLSISLLLGNRAPGPNMRRQE